MNFKLNKKARNISLTPTTYATGKSQENLVIRFWKDKDSDKYVADRQIHWPYELSVIYFQM